MKVELLPRKEFEITLENAEVIRGQYSLWSIKRFCDKKNLSLNQLQEAMSADKLTFDDVCEVLLCAVEFKCRQNKEVFKYTDVDACNWIESLGGLMGEDYIKLMNHAGNEEAEEKKSLVNQ